MREDRPINEPAHPMKIDQVVIRELARQRQTAARTTVGETFKSLGPFLGVGLYGRLDPLFPQAAKNADRERSIGRPLANGGIGSGFRPDEHVGINPNPPESGVDPVRRTSGSAKPIGNADV